MKRRTLANLTDNSWALPTGQRVVTKFLSMATRLSETLPDLLPALLRIRRRAGPANPQRKEGHSCVPTSARR